MPAFWRLADAWSTGGRADAVADALLWMAHPVLKEIHHHG
jgi:hypothetical protein